MSARVKLYKSDIEALNKIKLRLESRFSERILLSALGQLHGINDFKLKHGFKQLFGVTPHQYFLEQRMKAACLLLTDEEKTITVIAEELGYEHISAFCTAFKKRVGCRPIEYRNSVAVKEV